MSFCGIYTELGGGFKYFLFSPLFGKDFHLDWYFSKGLKPPTREQDMNIYIYLPLPRPFPMPFKHGVDPASSSSLSWDDRGLFILEAFFKKSETMKFQKYLNMFTRLWRKPWPNVWGLYYICFLYWKITFKCLFSWSFGWVRNAIWKVHPSRQLLEKGVPLLERSACSCVVVKMWQNIRMAQEVLRWIDSFLEA